MLENAVYRVPFILLVSRIIEHNFPIGNLEATYSNKHGSQINMAASSSSPGLHENIHSGFSLESDSDISTETETETETESETDTSDSEPIFMGNLQDIDKNNSEWHQVLDRDNDEPNFPQNFSPLGTPGPINCIPSTSIPHEYVIMLLGDEFIDLLVEEIVMEMQNSYQNQAMKI